MKYAIFFIMLLVIPFAIADNTFYDINDTVDIVAEYRVNNVLTAASARLSVFLPDGSTDSVVDNVTMTNISTGRFGYNFTCAIRGEHEAAAIFYNSSGDIAIDSDTFRCGSPASLSFTDGCPTETIGVVFLWIILVILITLAIVGMALFYPILTGAAGTFLIFMGIILWGCGDIITYLAIIFGLIFLMIAVASRNNLR